MYMVVNEIVIYLIIFRPVKISPVLVETSEEKRLFTLGEKNYNAKKALAETTLRKQTPNDQESDLIHAMWLRQLDYHGQYLDGNQTVPIYNQYPLVTHADMGNPKTPISRRESPKMSSIWIARGCTHHR